MKKKLVNVNCYIIILMLIQLVLAIKTWHDVAMAQGVGLYCAMQVGSQERLPYDIIVDICGFIGYVAAMILPPVLLARKSWRAIFRFEAAYLAFMPFLYPAMLVHLFDGRSLLAVEFDLFWNANLLFSFVREVVPLVFILALIYRMNGYVMKKWQIMLLAAELLLCLGMAFFPEITDVCLFLMHYLLLIISFEQWEKLWEKERTFWGNTMAWLIFALFYLRGCHRMLELMACY